MRTSSASPPASWRLHERRVFRTLLLVFLLFLIPALLDARRQERDAERIRLLAETKRAIEGHNNTHGLYPVPKRDVPLSCAVAASAPSPLFFGVPEAGEARLLLPHDPWRNKTPFVYCPSDIRGDPGAPGTAGFFLEAVLEHARRPTAGFDYEAERNYRFRVYRDGGRAVYRICGGTDSSCDRDAPIAHYERQTPLWESAAP